MNILFALVGKPKTSQFGIVQCPFHLFISKFQSTKYNFQCPELDDGNICWRPPLDLMAILALGVSVKHQQLVQWLDHGWTSRLVNLRFLLSLTPKLIVFFWRDNFFRTPLDLRFFPWYPLCQPKSPLFLGLHEADESRELSWLMSSEGIDEFWGYYMTYCLYGCVWKC